MAVLPQTDERDRAQVTWTLALLRESQAADAIMEYFTQGRLQSMDGFAPEIIMETLGPERLAGDELMQHDIEAVRVLTAHALAEGHAGDVVEPLTRMLSSELERQTPSRDERVERPRSAEVIRAVTAGLGRTGDERAARPLFNVLTSHADLRSGVLDALRQSASGPQIAVLAAQASDRDLVLELVRMLSGSRDPRVADNLATFLDHEDAEIRASAAFGLAEFEDTRAAPVLIAIARAAQDRSDEAYGVLRRVASPEVGDQLKELLELRPARRADILRAMGHTEDSGFERLLIEQLEDTDIGAAALALADLDSDRGFVKLRRLAIRPRNTNMGTTRSGDRLLATQELLDQRRAALLGLARYRRSDIFDEMLAIVEDGQDDFELREIAAANIGMVATDEQMRQVIAKVRDPGVSLPARKYYAQAFWQKARPELTSTFLDLAGDMGLPYEVNRAAALAVGYTADPANDERLIEMLQNERTERGAAMAIALGGGPAAVNALMQRLAESRELSQILQDAVTSEERDWFSLITEDMAAASIPGRLRAGDLLSRGLEGSSERYTYAWSKALSVIRDGWSGPGGATRGFLREQLWQLISGDDPAMRALAAKAMRDLPERGMLLRARDAEGVASEAARALLNAELRADEEE